MKDGVGVLFADDQTTHHYASVFRQLRKQGTPIPTNEMWLASLVLQTTSPCTRTATSITCRSWPASDVEWGGLVAHAGEPTEVTVGGPQVIDAVADAHRGDARVIARVTAS